MENYDILRKLFCELASSISWLLYSCYGCCIAVRLFQVMHIFLTSRRLIYPMDFSCLVDEVEGDVPGGGGGL